MRITAPRVVVRLEGIAVLVLSVMLYARSGNSWLLFAILFLGPDASILGYLRGPRLGAAAYNLLHTYVWPVVLAIIGLSTSSPLLTAIALIWSAHIGADRLLGLGLKYPAAFKETHLQRL